jgi:hypothetical protein
MISIFDEKIGGHHCLFSATAYRIFHLGISSNIDPLGRFMHGAKPALKKNVHIHKETTKCS